MSEAEGTVVEKEPELSDVEKEAMAKGWKPKEEYAGDEDRWVDAGEFMRRDPLIKKIETYGRKLGDLEKTLHDFSEHHKKVKEYEYDRAVKDLKAKYKEALKDHDTELALKYTEDLDELEESHKNAPEVQVPTNEPVVNQEFESWVSENDWYANDSELHDFADEIAIGYVNRRGGPEKVDQRLMYKHVENVVKRQYPEKFSNPNRNRASSATTGDTNSTGTRKSGGFVLTPEQEAVARKFEAKGVMSYDKYVDELKKMEKQ